MQKFLACLFLLLGGFTGLVTAQSPALLKDINNALVSGTPRGMTTSGNTVYFSATDAVHGRELWKTTGTESSTVMVADINPSGDANPGNFCNVNGIVFFTASTPATGTELWRTDGTAAGTFMVSDLISGTLGSEPKNLTACNGRVYFSAIRRTVVPAGVIMELKLYVSDGTAAGTTVLDPVNTNVTNPDNLTAVGATLYYTGNANIIGNELWSTGGTQATTQLVHNFTPAANVSSNPSHLRNVNGNLLLAASDPVNGRQIWKLVPNPFNLSRLTSISVLGVPGFIVSEMVSVNGTVFFSASLGVPNLAPELLKLNSAVPGGAAKVTNVANVSNLTAVNSNLFFTQSPQLGGPILSAMAFNAQLATNIRTFNLIPNGEYPVPKNLVNVNGTLFFTAATAVEGRELWKASVMGASLVQDFVVGATGANITDLCARGSDLFFASDGAGGNELRKSDGTPNAIVSVRNIGRAGSFPKEFVQMGSFIYFTADDGISGRELWKTNGNIGNGTLVADIFPGSSGSDPANLIVITASNGNQTLYFEAKDQNKGRELFKLENTLNAAPTRLSDIVNGPGNAGIGNMTQFNGNLYFTASQGVIGLGDRIFKVNAARTAVENTGGPMTFANNLKAMGSTLFFTQSPQVGPRILNKIVNGATSQVGTFEPVAGQEDPIPQQLTVVGTRLFFTAANGAQSRRLWVTNSDASSVSTVSGHAASDLTNFNGRLVFTAPSLNVAGLRQILRVNQAFNGVETLATGSGISNLRAVGTSLFFFQAFNLGAIQLAKITVANNSIVPLGDFPQGNTGLLPEMAVAGNNLYFTMTDAATGNELWKTNGLANATLVSDIRPGVGHSNIQYLRVIGSDLYFSANDLSSGQEPWKLSNAAALEGGGSGEERSAEETDDLRMETTPLAPEIKVCPNPATNYVQVDLLQTERSGTLSLHSAAGQELKSIQSAEGETSIQIDLQDLPRGMYLVRWVQSDEQVVMKKLMVQ